MQNQMPVLVCPSNFKGSHSATEVAHALAAGIESAGSHSADICPVADGGDGTLDVILNHRQGQRHSTTAVDALGRQITTEFALIDGGEIAVVEVATVSGLAMLDPQQLNAQVASSFGTGLVINAAVQSGAKRILIAPGGSAMTDGGAGAITAIQECGGIGKTKLTVLCDVSCPYEEAAERFGPQKGADQNTVQLLKERNQSFAAEQLDRDPTGVKFTGAGGGLAGGLWAQYRAELVSGARYIIELTGFIERMQRARTVVIGEGRLDSSSLRGKISGEIAVTARQAGIPAQAVVGSSTLSLFEQRILDLQRVHQASSLKQIEAAGGEIADQLAL